jgi:PHD/YefM family antitoxin component YafN of YafNO toxin-antitoxin module
MEETSATIMCPLQKIYVLDENQEPIAVQISIADFQRLEAIIEDYGLATLMDEVLAGDVPQESVVGLSETEFLLRSPANVVHLERSIGQFRQGKFEERAAGVGLNIN